MNQCLTKKITLLAIIAGTWSMPFIKGVESKKRCSLLQEEKSLPAHYSDDLMRDINAAISVAKSLHSLLGSKILRTCVNSSDPMDLLCQIQMRSAALEKAYAALCDLHSMRKLYRAENLLAFDHQQYEKYGAQALKNCIDTYKFCEELLEESIQAHAIAYRKKQYCEMRIRSIAVSSAESKTKDAEQREELEKYSRRAAEAQKQVGLHKGLMLLADSIRTRTQSLF